MPSPVANLCRIGPAVPESSRLAGETHCFSHRDGGAGECRDGSRDRESSLLAGTISEQRTEAGNTSKRYPILQADRTHLAWRGGVYLWPLPELAPHRLPAFASSVGDPCRRWPRLNQRRLV